MSMLKLALRKIKSEGQESSDEGGEKENSALEQAMSDFANAKSPKDQAAAFMAALELAKD